MAKITILEQTAPATPAAGYSELYVDSADSHLKSKDDAGTVTDYTAVNLASATGVLPVANGGTNSSTALNNNRVMQSSGGAVVEAAAITASRALISDANGIPVHSAVTSTELGYVSGVTSAIQTQLGNKQPLDAQLTGLAAQTSSAMIEVWVSKDGNDSTGDGTPSLPYLTVSQAMSSISDASSTKRYAIKLRPGTYTEATLALKPWVWIVGQQYFLTRITVTSTQVTLDSSFSAGGDMRWGVRDIYFGGSTGFNFDLQSLGPNIGTPSAIFECEKVWMNGGFTFLGRSPSIDFIEAYDVLTFGTNTFDAVNLFWKGAVFQGASNFTATNGNTDGDMFGMQFAGAVTISAASGKTNTLRSYASRMDSTLSLSGSGVTFKSDAASMPTAKASFSNSSATFTIVENAQYNKYEATTASNWSTLPTNVSDALDYLAANGGRPVIFGTRGSPRSVVAGTGITSGASHMSTTAISQDVYIQGSGGAVSISANPQISAHTIDGATMRLIGRNDTNTVTLSDGNGLVLNGSAVMGADSLLTLRYDGTNWVEVSRST